MDINVQVPQLGESITEATVSAWLKSAGDTVAEGDVLVELETDKVMVEVPATQAGVLREVLAEEGATVAVGDVIARIDTDGQGAAPAAEKAAEPQPEASPAESGEPPAAKPAAAAARAEPAAAAPAGDLSPAVRRLVAEHRLDPAAIAGSGRGGRLTKEDVLAHLERAPAAPAAPAAAREAPAPPPPPRPATPREAGPRERREKMSRLRQRIAERLVEAQRTAAMLTTFNEVDMTAVMALRARYRDAFREKHGIALGFMSFFAKACIEALRAFPAVNAEIDGEDIIYKDHYDIGVAVGTERGLVVPVVRDADRLRFIEIELEIAALAAKARDNKLGLDDLSGGTFTISNGGIYGSMLSTPILNPPQSGILGMHNITRRPVVVDDQVVVRPMMYLALSYDHRIVDGREAVQFLVKVKACIEDPARMLLEI